MSSDPQKILRFHLDPILLKYNTEKKALSELGISISQESQDNFFKTIYDGCHNFRTFARYRKISNFGRWVFLFLVIVGVILLILGLLPLWEGGSNISVAVIITGGIIVLISLLLYCFWIYTFTYWYKKPLFKDYQSIIHEAVQKYLGTYLPQGLMWTGGEHGFMMLKFWASKPFSPRGEGKVTIPISNNTTNRV